MFTQTPTHTHKTRINQTIMYAYKSIVTSAPTEFEAITMHVLFHAMLECIQVKVSGEQRICNITDAFTIIGTQYAPPAR